MILASKQLFHMSKEEVFLHLHCIIYFFIKNVSSLEVSDRPGKSGYAKGQREYGVWYE